MFALTVVVMCGVRYATFYKLGGPESLEQEVEIRDHVEHQYFKNLSTMWESVEEECEGVEVKGKYDWTLPKWAEGVFVTSGPSKHEMNSSKFAHVLDGFGRFSNVNFRDGKALFTSKMIKSSFYNRSVE
jgi:carotenoid cleavage dioxygenase-like enzyme